jgi:hypothetical protein
VLLCHRPSALPAPAPVAWVALPRAQAEQGDPGADTTR